MSQKHHYEHHKPIKHVINIRSEGMRVYITPGLKH